MWSGISALFAGAFLGHAILPTAIKIGIGNVPPFTFSALRFVFASVLFTPFFFARKRQLLTKKDLVILLLLSLFCAGDVLFFSIGIGYTTAIISQIIYATDPLLVVVLSYFFLHERPNRYKIIGFLIALAGLGFLFQHSVDHHSIMTFGMPIGNFFMILGALSWSFYLVMSKKIDTVYSLSTLTFASCMVLACVFLLTMPFEWLVMRHIPHINTISLESSVIACISSVGMYLLVQYGIKKTTAFTASLFQYLGPLLAAVTAVPLLGERPNASVIVGGLLILAGVFYATTYPLLKTYIEKKIIWQQK